MAAGPDASCLGCDVLGRRLSARFCYQLAGSKPSACYQPLLPVGGGALGVLYLSFPTLEMKTDPSQKEVGTAVS